MTSGTPGFNGSRLREAREARAMTQVALSDFLGVTRQAVSMYESGTISPAPPVTRRMAEVLRVSADYFRQEYPIGHSLPPQGPMFFRSFNSAEKVFRLRAAQRTNWAVGIYAELLSQVEFPAPDLPDYTLPRDPVEIDEQTVVEIASDIRRRWGVNEGPIDNVVWLLENHGIVVIRDSVGAREIDAFSVWRDGQPFVVLSSDKGSAVRSRYDALHELGHLVVHRNVDEARLDRKGDHRLLEQQAHLFASAFLLPETGYRRSLLIPSLEEFQTLKPMWGASIAAQIERCKSLGLISASSHKRLWVEMSRHGWRQREPLDDKLSVEQPRLLQSAVEIALKEGLLDVATLLKQVPISLEDVEELTGLSLNPTGHGANVVSGKFSGGTQRPGAKGASDSGKIVEFGPR